MCCSRGGIGRRARLKIVYPKDVRVRVPWRAPKYNKKTVDYNSFFNYYKVYKH